MDNETNAPVFILHMEKPSTKDKLKDAGLQIGIALAIPAVLGLVTLGFSLKEKHDLKKKLAATASETTEAPTEK